MAEYRSTQKGPALQRGQRKEKESDIHIAKRCNIISSPVI